LTNTVTQCGRVSVPIWYFLPPTRFMPHDLASERPVSCAALRTPGSISERCRCLDGLPSHRCARTIGRIGPPQPRVTWSASIPEDGSTFPIHANSPSTSSVVHACLGIRLPDKIPAVWRTRKQSTRDRAVEGGNSAIQLSWWTEQADHRNMALLDE